MTVVEIPCLRFKDLKVRVPENPSQEELIKAKSKAVNEVYKCDKRTFGEQCIWGCALPAVALGETDQIEKAVAQAVKRD